MFPVVLVATMTNEAVTDSPIEVITEGEPDDLAVADVLNISAENLQFLLQSNPVVNAINQCGIPLALMLDMYQESIIVTPLAYSGGF